MLTKIHLPQHRFIEEIEERSPKVKLKHAAELHLLEQVIQTKVLTAELELAWDDLNSKDIAETLYADPRSNFLAKAHHEIKAYLKKVDQLLFAESHKQSNTLQKAGYFIGITDIPNITKIDQLAAIPVMPKKIERYYQIMQLMNYLKLQAEDKQKLDYILLRQRRAHSPDNSITTAPLESHASSSSTILTKLEGTSSEEHDSDNSEELRDSGTLIYPSSTFITSEKPFKPIACKDALPKTQYLDTAKMFKKPAAHTVLDKDITMTKSTTIVQKKSGEIQNNNREKALAAFKQAEANEKDDPAPSSTDIERTIKRGSDHSH